MNRDHRQDLAALLCMALLFSATPAVHAQINWTGTASNDWTDGNNWNPTTVPGPADTAQFNAAVANMSPVLNGTTQTLTAISFVPSAGSYTLGNAFTGNALSGDTFNLSGVTPISMTATNPQQINAAVTLATAGATISNGSTSVLTFGVLPTGAQPFIPLSLPAGTTTSTGPIVYNDTITGSGALTISGGATTFNGPTPFTGLLTIGGSNTVTMNGIRSGTGAVTDGTTSSAAAFTGTLIINAANTYSGGTTFTGNTSAPAQVLIGVSSVASPASGPFGTGTVTFSNANGPATLIPIGADRTISNPFTLTNGFFVATATAGQDPTGPHNLILTGTINVNKVLTNNMAPGVALIFAGPNNVTVTAGTFQTNVAGVGGTFIFNENVAGTTMTVQNGATVILNQTYGATGAILVKTNTASGQGTIGGTLIVNGTDTSAPINVNAFLTVGLGKGGVLGGTGSIGGLVTISTTVSTTQGGIIAPGPQAGGAGTLTVPAMTWNPFGRYLFKYDSNNNQAGGGVNSLIVGSGTLTLDGLGDINNASNTNRFDLNLQPLNFFSGTPGTTNYILATAPTITALTGTPLTSTPLTAGTDVSNLFSVSGTFTTVPSTSFVTVVNNPLGSGLALQLSFTPVPEPAFVLLACGGLTSLAAWRRKHRHVARG
jgi:hypothetical protein